jgi:hypothetical protein
MAFLKVNPTPRALVTLDTLFRTMAGKVMDPTDFQRYVDGCDMIRRKLKTAVLFLHHQKRNDASGGFGSIVQEASVEMAAKVSGGDKPGSSILTVEWFRDGDSNQENWTCRIEAREIDDPDLADDDVRKVPVLVFEQRGEDKDRSILGAIKAHSPKTVDALLAKIQRDGKPSKPTLERALRRLREEGKVAIGSLELTAKGMGFGPDKDDDKA